MSQQQQSQKLGGKIALVTGAAKGIGQAIATTLASHGADVVLVDVSPAQEIEPVAQEIRTMGRKAWVFEHDLAKADTLAKLAADAWAAAGRIDILVNNAGIATLAHFHDITLDVWRKVMAVNVDGPFFLAQAIAVKMIKAKIKGSIINITSKNGHTAEAGLAHYNTSKGALELMTQSLACELGPHGIRVNAVAPGTIQTTIGGKFEMDLTAFFDYIREHIPLENRLGQTREIAAAVAFMASDDASFVHGHSLVVDGGVQAQQMPRLQFMPPAKYE